MSLSRISRPLNIIIITVAALGITGCTPLNKDLNVNAILYQNSFNSKLYYELLDGTQGGFLENNLHVTHRNGHLFWPEPLYPEYQLGTIDDGPEQRLALHSFFGAPSKTIYPHADRVISHDLTQVAYQEGDDIVIEHINPKKEGKVLQTEKYKVSISGRIQFFSPTGKYLYFKTNTIPGSTPYGDEALLDLNTGNMISVDVEDYFTKPIPSPIDDSFLIAKHPSILSGLTVPNEVFKLLLYTIGTNTWKLIDSNSEVGYSNISWHKDGNIFVFQNSVSYAVQVANSPAVDYYCNAGIELYNLELNKKQNILPGNSQECIFLIGFTPDSDAIYFISKNLENNRYYLESMNMEGSVRTILHESTKPIDFFAFVHIPE